MGKIVCLMGKSSTGKDTLFKLLLNVKQLNLKNVVTYTTRPIRDRETEGVEYHFVDEGKYLELKKSGKIAEEREYNTCYGLWRYFTVDDGSVDMASGYNYLMIGTLESYMSLRKYFGKDKLIPVYVEVDDGERLKRALAREMKQEHPRYEEMCRRYLADSEDFSDINIEAAGIERRFRNEEKYDCLSEITEYIRQWI